MIIQDLFSKDINRSINGVVKVQDASDDSVRQELDEYVVTRELRGHFSRFFDSYERAIDEPTDKIGVWISGFFGSGKSHFLKMLSYLLQNDEVAGKPAIDYFEDKISDPMVASKMRRCCNVPTEAILFNIDSKGGHWKEGDTLRTALLRAFERVFFEHLGFFGEDLKLARLERHIDSKGKTQEFRAAYERISGGNWLEDRESYSYFEDDIVEVLQEVLGMSEQTARHWFDGSEDDAIASDAFVNMVKRYVDKRAAECGGEFRLLFMVDEVGQFIGSDAGVSKDLMLSLQTLVEGLGNRCGGRVWVMVTSQEAIDGNAMFVGSDFSTIQGRFNTRLSLSSSSVDEVIQRRVLQKNNSGVAKLEQGYETQSAVLKNIFAFDGSRSDLIGYFSRKDFTDSYPFVNYQFKVMPDVMTEVRKHGVKAKHMSTGERSMLSAFQESAQAIQEQELGALVPFWRFFDTIAKDLEHGVIQTVTRAERAAEDGLGLQTEDVKILKLLYLIRYIDYIKSNIENISILMVDRMDVDKVALKSCVKDSLDRLVRENYVARQGDTYNFLTDEEQRISRIINDTSVDAALIIEGIKKTIFEGVYKDKKLRVGANDFPFDRYVDDSAYGVVQGGMKLNVVTVANDLSRADDAELAVKSANIALVVLADDVDYFYDLQNAAKIRKYRKTINTEELQPSTQQIVQAKMKEASYAEREATELLKEAVLHARVAVNGSIVNIRATKPADVFDQALSKLTDAIFTKADYIADPAKTDEDIRATLRGANQMALDGQSSKNARAEKEVADFLHLQTRMSLNTTMGDLQRKFQSAPYGWREIDIANVMAQLVVSQRATITAAGANVAPTDLRMVTLLRKDADKAQVRERVKMSDELIKKVNRVLRETFDAKRDIANEDELTATVVDTLTGYKNECVALTNDNFTGLAPAYPYPGLKVLEDGIKLTTRLLANQNDAQALFNAFVKAQDDLDDWKEDYDQVVFFFESQKPVFDKAVEFMGLMRDEGFYMDSDAQAVEANKRMEQILKNPRPYHEVRDLHDLMEPVMAAHKQMVDTKRKEMLDDIAAQMAQVHEYAQNQDGYAKLAERAIEDAGRMAKTFENRAHSATKASELAALKQQLIEYCDRACEKIDNAIEDEKARQQRESRRKEVTPTGEIVTTVKDKGEDTPATAGPAPAPAPKIKKLRLADLGERKKLQSESDIDAYLGQLRARLLAELQGNDAIRLS